MHEKMGNVHISSRYSLQLGDFHASFIAAMGRDRKRSEFASWATPQLRARNECFTFVSTTTQQRMRSEKDVDTINLQNNRRVILTTCFIKALSVLSDHCKDYGYRTGE